jgi:arylsulfatase A-like enzyme
MNRRTFLESALAGLAGARTAHGAGKRPNVLLILADDQGYGDLSLHGNPYLNTPNMDRLAGQGIEFTRFYVSPVCAPTRSSLLTGRYNVRCGVHGVTAGMETMPTAETTIAEAMRPAGYRTALYGKWHLGSHYPNVPHGQGFEEFIGFRTGHWINYWDPKLEHNGKPYPAKGYITQILTDLAIRYLETNRNDPFFLYLAYNVPHSPFMVPERYWNMYKDLDLPERSRAAYALTKCLDDNLGRLMAKVDELKLAEDTIVIFLSDNGPAGVRYNAGLRGAKGSVYEGGNREPFFIRWTGRLAAGKKIDTIAAHVDIYPTLLDMCGVARPKGLPIDGRSIYPLLKGETKNWPDRMLFVHAEKRNDPSAMYPGTVRTQRFNLVGGKELYEIPVDPGETANVADKYPEVTKRLRAAYESWYKDALPKGGFQRLPIPVGYDEENPAWLPAPEGYLHGSLEYYGKAGFAHDWVTNWKSVEDFVHWDVEVAHGGSYEVSLNYLCAAADIGSKVEVRVGDAAVSAVITESTPMEPIVMRDVIPRQETPEMHWKVMRVGVLRMNEGKARLEVRAIEKKGERVMDLDRVYLRKI